MSWKAWAVLILLLVAGGALAGGWYMHHRAQQQLTLKDLELAQELRLRDSTHARLAVTRAANDSLELVVHAAKELHGKLLAALALEIDQRDTVIQHDTVETGVVGETRTARFHDSTFAGTIAGTITAPPFPQPLQLAYQIVRPSFRPEVGFVQVGDSLVAIVNWRGEEVRIGAPYATRRLLGEPTWSWTITGLVGLNHYTTRVDGTWRVSSRLQLLAEVSQDVRVGTHQHGPQVRAGVRVRP